MQDKHSRLTTAQVCAAAMIGEDFEGWRLDPVLFASQVKNCFLADSGSGCLWHHFIDSHYLAGPVPLAEHASIGTGLHAGQLR